MDKWSCWLGAVFSNSNEMQSNRWPEKPNLPEAHQRLWHREQAHASTSRDQIITPAWISQPRSTSWDSLKMIVRQMLHLVRVCSDEFPHCLPPFLSHGPSRQQSGVFWRFLCQKTSEGYWNSWAKLFSSYARPTAPDSPRKVFGPKERYGKKGQHFFS